MPALITAFPREIILQLHTGFNPGQVEERIRLIDDFLACHAQNLSPDFLNKEVNGHKALVHYQGKQYANAAELYLRSAQNSSPGDMLYFHEHCMVARCYRLAGDFEKSEDWIKKTYALKHIISSPLELLDFFADYVGLLNDTYRKLDPVYLSDLQWIIMEAGMEVRLNEDDLNQVVLEMKKLNHEENILYSRIHVLMDQDQQEGTKQLKDFISRSRIRFYKQMAQEYLESLNSEG